MGMPDATPLIPDELIQKVEDLAREQNPEPAGVVEEAVGRYLASRRLERFAETAERRALTRGIREEDVPRLVEEVGRENEVCGRQAIRVTADTNVLISGLIYRRGKPYELLQLALSGKISLSVSRPILDEMADVLMRKFGARRRRLPTQARSSRKRPERYDPPFSWTSLKTNRTIASWNMP